MSKILKHSFEAVSLLTADNGMLEVTVVPATNQPDWIVPSSLILSVDAYDERIWTYLWQQQEVAVFHLLPRDQTPDKLVVLEGNTAVHRMALQTTGTLQNLKVRISDVKDAELPDHYLDVASSNMDSNLAKYEKIASKEASLYGQEVAAPIPKESYIRENVITSYLFQVVTIEGTHYLVPDLDKIAHQLVDLDS